MFTLSPLHVCIFNYDFNPWLTWILYILTGVWVLHTPNVSRNSHFHYFCAEKQKKQEICSKMSQKHVFCQILQQISCFF